MDEYCKILIVDDEFIMRQGMKHMLDWEKEGFHIVGEATNGKEGIDMIESLKPDIVMADIVMPVIDGIEFSSIVSKKFPDVQLIILSSYDNFEYVKTTLLNGAADYILKPTLNPVDLLQVLNKVAKNIPGFTLKRGNEMNPSGQIERFLLGYQTRLDENVFSDIFPHSVFQIVGINLKELCDDKRASMARMREMVYDSFENEPAYCFVEICPDEEILAYILNYRWKDQKQIDRFIDTYAERMKEMRPHAFFVKSRKFSCLQDIKNVYEEDIQPFVHDWFYYPKQAVLDGAEVEPQGIAQRFAFEEYTSCLMSSQYRKALWMYEEYTKKLVQYKTEQSRLKNLSKNLFYNYLVEIEKYQIPAEELKKMYFKKIDLTEDVGEFWDVMMEIFRELEKCVETIMNEEDERIQKIKNYINRHFAEDLELTELADRFGFSYHYLSSYFNRQTNEGYREYLNKIRIEKACEFLKNPNLAICEVSSYVGYADHSYFCRVFKKYTGETPSAYRRKRQERKE